MQAKIEIIHVVQNAGTSRKTGNSYDIRNAQCIVCDTDPATGEVRPKIGVLSLPERYKELPRGVYSVEFEAAIDIKRRVVSEVSNIRQWDGSAEKAPVRTVLVEVLSVNPLTGFSQKTLKDYDMRLADCIVHKVDRESGDVSPLVGELVIPDRFKDIKPGKYDVEFQLFVGRDKRIGGGVASMTPHQSVGRPEPAARKTDVGAAAAKSAP
jgi:hypothetical protein